MMSDRSFQGILTDEEAVCTPETGITKYESTSIFFLQFLGIKI